jgi:oligopeptide/dipeptide ABC transporter ATP-binding protein
VTAPLLEVRDLARHFRQRGTGRRPLKAVDGVSFTIAPGTTLGIVGESGSGKSTLARLVMALDRPTSGGVLFEGNDLFALGAPALKRLRRGFQMVFQDPYGSLDPRQSVARIVAEPLHLDREMARGRSARARVDEALIQVGLSPVDGKRFAHQFSGGQRQRVAIARALVCGPRLVVADEPVSALDLSVQAQVLNLLMDLRDRQGLAFLFISHNLAVVETIADRIAVMYRGRFVETGSAAEIFRCPSHPYTRALIAAEPRLESPRRRAGASAARPTTTRPAEDAGSWDGACAFAPRCPHARAECAARSPAPLAIGGDHEVTCHFAGRI